MMIPRLITVSLILFLAGNLFAQNRKDQWREDISALRDTLQSKQMDFETLASEREFNANLEQLLDNITSLKDSEIKFRLQELVATMGVSHSEVTVRGRERIPIGFEIFDDGLFIVAISEPYTDYIGQKVLAINTIPTREILRRSGKLFSYENDSWLEVKLTNNLNNVDFLRYIETINSQDTIKVATMGKNHLTFPVTLRSKKMVMDEDIKKLLLFETRGKNYWFKALNDSTLYIQYSRCREDPKQSIGEFAQEVSEMLDNPSMDKVIFDLRLNGGGDSNLIRSLTKVIKESVPENVFVLTGKRTFSSGVLSAMHLKEDLNGTIVGNETGGSPNSYGEVKRFQLPNSKLEVAYTTDFISHGEESWNTLYPDVVIPYLSQFYLEGVDPVLEFIVNQ